MKDNRIRSDKDLFFYYFALLIHPCVTTLLEALEAVGTFGNVRATQRNIQYGERLMFVVVSDLWQA